MCTVSWEMGHKYYSVFFNRDEQNARAVAEGPKFYPAAAENPAWIAPCDLQGGGTWAGVNDQGMSTFLLNAYGLAVNDRKLLPKTQSRSRGLLVQNLLTARTVVEWQNLLKTSVTSHHYQPFWILCFSKVDKMVQAYQWDGENLRSKSLQIPFLSSSSIDSKRIEQVRKRCFLSSIDFLKQPSTLQLSQFHRHYCAENPAASILMQRSDARTVSVLKVTVTERSAEIIYCPVYADTQPRLGKPQNVWLTLQCSSERNFQHVYQTT